MLTALGRDGSDVRFALAKLAPLVAQAAERDDAVARDIVAEATRQLAALILAASAQADLGDQFALALAGGVICGSGLIRAAMLAELQERQFAPTSVELVDEPVLGCLRLAVRKLAMSEG